MVRRVSPDGSQLPAIARGANADPARLASTGVGAPEGEVRREAPVHREGGEGGEGPDARSVEIPVGHGSAEPSTSATPTQQGLRRLSSVPGGSSGDASGATPGKKKRGRPKGSRNRIKLPDEGGGAAADPIRTTEPETAVRVSEAPPVGPTEEQIGAALSDPVVQHILAHQQRAFEEQARALLAQQAHALEAEFTGKLAEAREAMVAQLTAAQEVLAPPLGALSSPPVESAQEVPVSAALTADQVRHIVQNEIRAYQAPTVSAAISPATPAPVEIYDRSRPVSAYLGSYRPGARR
jgi:hypothetical protein